MNLRLRRNGLGLSEQVTAYFLPIDSSIESIDLLYMCIYYILEFFLILEKRYIIFILEKKFKLVFLFLFI